jgi:hypothetical protein
MLNRRILALSLAVGATLTAPLVASAASPYHPAPTEAGVTYHPDHAGGDKTRSQVLAELDTASKERAWASTSRGAPWPVTSAVAAKTRDEVQAENLKAMRAGTIPSGER